MIAYALIGVLFFKGNLENRCRLSPFPINGTWQIDPTIYYLCGEYECPEKLSHSFFFPIAKYIFFRTFCGNPAAFNIPQNETEYEDDYTLYYGYFNFDNIFMSLFTSLSFLSITGWSNVNDIVIFFFINIS